MIVLVYCNVRKVTSMQHIEWVILKVKYGVCIY